MSPVGQDQPQTEIADDEALGISFATAEGYYEYLKAKRLRMVIRYAGGLILLAGFGYAMFVLGGGGKVGEDRRSDGTRGDEMSPNVAKIDPAGLPSAKVKVMAILPEGSDCHSSIATYLTKIATDNPAVVRVDFKTMGSFSDKELADKVGQVCAAILVNDKTEFTHQDGEGPVSSISLVGTVPTHYTLDDLGHAINQTFHLEYGEDATAPVEIAAKNTTGCTEGSSCSATQECPEEPEPAPEVFTLPGFREMKSGK